MVPTFWFAQKSRRLRVVLNDPKGSNGTNDGQCTLYNKYPRPRRFTGNTVHIRYGGREQTA